jgi:hypothetical protein
MQHRRLRPGPSRTALCSMRRNQVQNGAVGDAEQSDRADEGGEAGDGKPAVAAEIELPRPLPLNSQPAGNKRSPISMISCVSARTCLASSAAISTCRLVHSRRCSARDRSSCNHLGCKLGREIGLGLKTLEPAPVHLLKFVDQLGVSPHAFLNMLSSHGHKRRWD